MQQNGDALEYVSKELRSDREIVLAAVKQNGDALKHASEELQCDRKTALAAVKQSGIALEYACEELRSDSWDSACCCPPEWAGAEICIRRA